MRLIVSMYNGFMEGSEGKEQRSFLQFPEADGPLHKQRAPLGAIEWNKRNDQHMNDSV